MTAATVDKYVEAYFPGLKTALDAIDSAIYADLVANAAVTITYFDTSFLTSAQLNQAQGLLVAIDGSEFSSVPGNAQEKYYSKLKIYDRTMEKDIGLDSLTGAFCRLLRITLKEYNAKIATQRSSIYTKIKSNSIFQSPDLDQRGKIYRDYEITDVRTDRESFPLDNRYL